ncbi:MAG: CHASE2 domain-containing sensor protein [Myxococcota bacterium]|jgi:CHASE2 domain-containing sensor protein
MVAAGRRLSASCVTTGWYSPLMEPDAAAWGALDKLVVELFNGRTDVLLVVLRRLDDPKLVGAVPFNVELAQASSALTVALKQQNTPLRPVFAAIQKEFPDADLAPVARRLGIPWEPPPTGMARLAERTKWSLTHPLAAARTSLGQAILGVGLLLFVSISTLCGTGLRPGGPGLLERGVMAVGGWLRPGTATAGLDPRIHVVEFPGRDAQGERFGASSRPAVAELLDAVVQARPAAVYLAIDLEPVSPPDTSALPAAIRAARAAGVAVVASFEGGSLEAPELDPRVVAALRVDLPGAGVWAASCTDGSAFADDWLLTMAAIGPPTGADSPGDVLAAPTAAVAVHLAATGLDPRSALRFHRATKVLSFGDGRTAPVFESVLSASPGDEARCRALQRSDRLVAKLLYRGAPLPDARRSAPDAFLAELTSGAVSFPPDGQHVVIVGVRGEDKVDARVEGAPLLDHEVQAMLLDALFDARFVRRPGGPAQWLWMFAWGAGALGLGAVRDPRRRRAALVVLVLAQGLACLLPWVVGTRAVLTPVGGWLSMSVPYALLSVIRRTRRAEP